MVSELILLVGAGSNGSEEQVTRFTIHKLSAFIEQFVGVEGVIIISIGFIAASLSSQLTMPIGATVLIESVWFHWDRVDEEKAEGRVVAELEVKEKSGGPVNDIPSKAHELEVKEKSGGPVNEIPSKAQLERRCFIMKQSINFAIVIIATVVISTNVDRLVVILVAQVFNVCRLLCINDEQFMGRCPQKGWHNVFLVIGVTITLLLASNVIVQKVLSSVLTLVWQRVLLALGMALTGIITLSLTTTLGSSLLKSWGVGQKGEESRGDAIEGFSSVHALHT